MFDTDAALARAVEILEENFGDLVFGRGFARRSATPKAREGSSCSSTTHR